jgi:hypothetical protein
MTALADRWDGDTDGETAGAGRFLTRDPEIRAAGLVTPALIP